MQKFILAKSFNNTHSLKLMFAIAKTILLHVATWKVDNS